MEFIIRPTVPDDLPELLQIATDPLVTAQQYALRDMKTVERWHWAIFEGGFGWAFTHSTIVVGDGIAGYLSRHFTRMPRQRIRGIYGWNIAPKFWGRGLMPLVLRKDFASHFDDPRMGEMQIDCFRSNRRCIRVLEKVGCRTKFLNPIDRVLTMLESRNVRWITRYQMTRSMWEARRATDAITS